MTYRNFLLVFLILLLKSKELVTTGKNNYLLLGQMQNNAKVLSSKSSIRLLTFKTPYTQEMLLGNF